VMREIDTVDLVLTDPPYNCSKDYGVFKDNLPQEDYEDWIVQVIEESRRIANNQAWIAPRYQLGFYFRLFPDAHLVVIRRGASGPFRGGWSDQFETALAVGMPNKCKPDLWDDIRLKGEGYFFRENTYDHPGYTPQKIMNRFVDLLSTKSVLDPFMGTGTTAVACERYGRAWIGIELSREYCDIAVKRIEKEARQMKLEIS